MIDLNDFITTNTNQAVSYDGVAENTGQCEQLVCVYWRDVYGFKCPLIPAAKDLWTNPTVLTTFQQIPVGQERAGDVGVWDASALINSPEFGHTDIVISPGFLGFDSNWGGVNNGKYPIAHQVRHNYTDVLGFLRYKGGNMPYVEQYVIDDYEKWKKMGEFLSQQPAYLAMGGTNGEALGDPTGIKIVLDDYEKIKRAAAGNAVPLQLTPGIYEVK